MTYFTRLHTDEHHNYCMLPNECSWSHCKENNFRTRNIYFGNSENIFHYVDMYRTAFSNGLVKILNGQYWKMSVQRIKNDSSSLDDQSVSSDSD